MRPSCLALTWVLLAGALAPADAQAGHSEGVAAQQEAGKRIYRQGILPTGRPVQGRVQGDVDVQGTQLNCMGCHRRSGLGSSESGRLIPPVTAQALYQPQELRRQRLYRKLYPSQPGPALRGPYDHASLRRAIRDGVDPEGRRLDPLMPRYRLDDPELDALIAYLDTLSAAPAPGVDDKTIHFATVVTQGTEPERRQAMLDVLQAFFRDKNAGTRHETRRAEHPPWYKDWDYQAYRKWALHVWELKGPATTWRDQLKAYYRQQPVYAVLSGIGPGDWRPIHDFCAGFEVPCLFPNTDLPVVDGNGDYTVYFSKGLTLEAEILAAYLRAGGDSGLRLVQVYPDRTPGRTAAAALRRALEGDPAITIRDLRLPAETGPTAGFWQRLCRDEGDARWVLWLNDADLQGLGGAAPCPNTVYLSGSLVGQAWAVLPEGLRPRVTLIYPFALPHRPARGSIRAKLWLHAKGIAPGDERVQLDTYFAATLTGMALRVSLDNFSRDYLIERIEHMTENSVPTGAYPHLSLAPGQRFASKGGHLVKPVETRSGTRLEPVSDWIVP